MRSSQASYLTSLIARLVQPGKPLFFRERQPVYSVGDPSEHVYFLLDAGSIKLSLTSADGKEAVINVLYAGDFFGENALAVSRTPRPTSAIALTNVRVAKIDRDVMRRLLDTEEELNRAFIANMIKRSTQLATNIADQLLYGGEQRLARALLSIAQLGVDERAKLLPKVTQQDLANMIGITRQRVNALMKQFRRMGFIDYSDGLRVHSALRDAARSYSRRNLSNSSILKQ